MGKTLKKNVAESASDRALVANREVVAGSLTAVSGWVTSEVRHQRCVCSGVVRSAKCRNLAYPMLLDIMQDGIFAIATFPSPVRQSAYGEVCQMLNRLNYRARYGKFVLNDTTGEVKFRVFRSSADVRCHQQESMSLLTSLPAQMLDRVVGDIDKFVEGRSSPSLPSAKTSVAKRGRKR